MRHSNGQLHIVKQNIHYVKKALGIQAQGFLIERQEATLLSRSLYVGWLFDCAA